MPSAAPIPQRNASASRIRCSPCRRPSTAISPLASSRPIRQASHAMAFIAASRFVCAQEPEELDAFTQTPLHHVPAHQHLAHDLPDLRRPEIEALVKALNVVIDLLTREMWITNGGELYAFLAPQVDDLVLLQAAVLHRLVVERRARIRRRQRHLDR